MISAEKGTNRYKFKNLQALWFVPIVIYFDFESFLKLVHSCTDNPSLSSTWVVQKHEGCGYSLAVIDRSFRALLLWLWQLWSIHEKMFQPVASISERDIRSKRRFPHFLWSRESLNKESTSTIWICCLSFTNEHEKCLDHFHFSGKFLGWWHEKCNLAGRKVNFTSVVGRDIQNYNLHHICIALHECEPTSTMNVKPSTDETCLSLSFGVLIKTIKRKNGTDQKVFEHLRFIDSCMFLNSSLQKLVDNLPVQKVLIWKEYFANETEE